MMLHIFSIALQFAGGAILLYNSMFSGVEGQILDYFTTGATGTFHKFEENGIELPQETIRKLSENILLNKCAFVNLALGYMIAAGEQVTLATPYRAIMLVIILTFAIIFVEKYFFVRKISDKKAKRGVTVPFDRIPNDTLGYKDLDDE